MTSRLSRAALLWSRCRANAPWRELAATAGIVAFALVYLWLRHGQLGNLQKALGYGATFVHDFKHFFYPMGDALLEAHKPIEGFFYSPTAALFFTALAQLPYAVASVVWAVLLAASAIVLGWSLRWTTENASPALTRGCFALTVLAYPVWHNLKFGQVSIPLVLLVTLSLIFYQRGRFRTAAMMLAAAVVLKYYVALFVLFLLARRDLRTLAWTGGGIVVGLVIVPALILGPGDAFAFYQDVAAQLATRFGGVVKDSNSQGMLSVAARWSDHTAWGTYLGYCRWGVAVALLAWSCKLATSDERDDWTLAFALLFAVTPFVIATSWPHYFCYMPFVCFVAWSRLAECQASAAWWIGQALVVAAAVLISMPFFDFVADRKHFVRAGMPFIANAAAIGALVCGHLARRSARSWKPDLLRLGGLALFVAALAVVVTGHLRVELYDDAYFFKRFALNFLNHGTFAWNVADGPVYGNTSQLYQLAVTIWTFVAGDYTFFAIRLFLGGCLLFAGAMLTRRLVDPEDAVPVYLALLSPIAWATSLSGMETALVFALEAALIYQLRRDDQTPWLEVVLVLAVYLCRPDAVVLAGGAVVLSRWARGRPFVAVSVAIAIGLAALLAVLKLYYGTFFPLSFYAKTGSLSVYDAHFIARSMADKKMNLILFGIVAIPLLGIALHKLDRRTAALLLPVVVFVSYHALSTIEVMGMHARFYAPALPFIAAAAAESYSRYRERGAWWLAWALGLAVTAATVWAFGAGVIPTLRGWPVGRVAPAAYGAFIAGVWLTLWLRPAVPRWRVLAVPAALGLGLAIAHPAGWFSMPSDGEYVATHRRHVGSYKGLSQLTMCLGTEIHTYHSEIGVMGMVFLGQPVTDLGGLMTPGLTVGDDTFDAMCQRDRPAAIFMPHRNYRTLNAEIRKSQCLEDYEQVTKKTTSPLLIRRDLLPSFHCPAYAEQQAKDRARKQRRKQRRKRRHKGGT